MLTNDCVPLHTGVQNPVDWVHPSFFAVQPQTLEASWVLANVWPGRPSLPLGCGTPHDPRKCPWLLYSQVFSCVLSQATLVSLLRLRIDLSSVQCALGSVVLRITDLKSHPCSWHHSLFHFMGWGRQVFFFTGMLQNWLTIHPFLLDTDYFQFWIAVNHFSRHIYIHLHVNRCFYFPWCELYCSTII